MSRRLRENLADKDLTDKERRFALFRRNAEGVVQVPEPTEAPTEISEPVETQCLLFTNNELEGE